MESLLDFERQYFRQHALDGCPNPRPLSDICRMDLSRLRHPWPDKRLLDEVRCSFAQVLASIRNPNKFPSLRYSIWDQITSLTQDKRIYRAEVDSVPMLLKLEELHRRHTDHPLHEAFVGYQLNQFKSEIPFFAYMFGAFGCSYPMLDQLPCSSIQPAGNYNLYEFIDGKPLDQWKNQITFREAWQVVRMIIATLKILNNRIGFVHQDIHFGNILVRRLDTYYTFVIGGETFVSQYLPSIIDYARSRIVFEGRVLSPKDDGLQIPAGTEYDLSALIHSWIIFSGDLIWEIPTETNLTRSFLRIYDIYTKADYTRVLNYLDDKYPPIYETGPLFTEDQAVLVDRIGEPCLPLMSFSPEVLEKSLLDLDERITRLQTKMGWLLVKEVQIFRLLNRRPPAWINQLCLSIIRNPPEKELLKAIQEVSGFL